MRFRFLLYDKVIPNINSSTLLHIIVLGLGFLPKIRWLKVLCPLKALSRVARKK